MQLIREYEPHRKLLAIGDGANDVSMIAEANIGVGISGSEGNQAVSSSDYAIGQFKHLKTLMLYHGRESYRRNAYLICYMFYKNLLQNAPMFIYGVVSGFSGQIFYETIMTQTFNLIFTSWPIIIYATWDKEYPKEVLVENPFLYHDGINNRSFSTSIFWQWFVFTFAQSIFMLTVCEGFMYGALSTGPQGG